MTVTTTTTNTNLVGLLPEKTVIDLPAKGQRHDVNNKQHKAQIHSSNYLCVVVWIGSPPSASTTENKRKRNKKTRRVERNKEADRHRERHAHRRRKHHPLHDTQQDAPVREITQTHE